MPFITRCPHPDCGKYQLIEDEQNNRMIDCLVCRRKMQVGNPAHANAQSPPTSASQAAYQPQPVEQPVVPQMVPEPVASPPYMPQPVASPTPYMPQPMATPQLAPPLPPTGPQPVTLPPGLRSIGPIRPNPPPGQ